MKLYNNCTVIKYNSEIIVQILYGKDTKFYYFCAVKKWNCELTVHKEMN